MSIGPWVRVCNAPVAANGPPPQFADADDADTDAADADAGGSAAAVNGAARPRSAPPRAAGHGFLHRRWSRCGAPGDHYDGGR